MLYGFGLPVSAQEGLGAAIAVGLWRRAGGGLIVGCPTLGRRILEAREVWKGQISAGRTQKGPFTFPEIGRNAEGMHPTF